MSAIAQSLAAILAFTFTISLLVAQLSVRFSPRMLAAFFDAFTVSYMVFFIIALLLSLGLLANPSPVAAKFSLTITAAVLSLLVPYYLSFKDRLDPAALLRTLTAKGARRLKRVPGEVPVEAEILQNFVMSFLAHKDYESYYRGVRLLVNWALDAYENGHEQFGSLLLTRVKNFIGLGSLEDPVAAWEVAINLHHVTEKAVEKRLEKARHQMAFDLHDFGLAVAKKGWESATESIALALSNVGAEAVRTRQSHILEQVISALKVIGQTSVQKGMNRAVNEILSSLRTLRKNVEYSDQWLMVETIESAVRAIRGQTSHDPILGNQAIS